MSNLLHDDDDARNFYYDEHGIRRRRNHGDVVPPGGSVRVSLIAMDSVQRSVADHYAAEPSAHDRYLATLDAGSQFGKTPEQAAAAIDAAARRICADRGVQDARIRADDARIASMQRDADEVRRRVQYLEGADAAKQALIDRDPSAKAYQEYCQRLQAGSR